MSELSANGIRLEFEDTGEAGRPVVLLVMGLGMQLVAWPQAFVDAIHEAGYRVIRFDNRDIGLSQHFDQLGIPNLVMETLRHRVGMAVHAPYTLQDMAADSIGLLDAVGVQQAHVVGVSMGGMIAQRMALAAPGRVRSLTSIMSSSGARYLPGPKSQVLRAMMSRPQRGGEEALVDYSVKFFKLIGSPGFPLDEAAFRERIRLATRRSFHPAGTMRQMVAIAADTRRADELARLKLPTLVVHGKADPLVPFACGQDVARRISGSRLVAVEGMGHDLPPGVVDRLLEPLIPHLRGH